MAKKRKRKGSVQRAHRVDHFANPGKVASLVEVLKAYRHLVAHYASVMTRKFHAGEPIFSHVVLKKADLPFETPLPHRMLELAWAQAYSAHASQRELMHSAMVVAFMRAELAAEDRSALIRLSARRVHQAPARGESVVRLTKWRDAAGALVHDSDALNAVGTSEPVQVAVEPSLLRVFQRVQAGVLKRHALPRMVETSTMILDKRTAQLVASNSPGFTHWLKVSSTVPRKFIEVPVALNQRVDLGAVNGAHLSFDLSGDVPVLTLRLTDKHDPAPLRTEGEVVGLDWGVGSLFATHTGDQHGRQFLQWLKWMDFEVTELEKALNRQRVKFKDSSRWCRLTKRIQDRTKNEVNRILNLVARDAKELVVESLDFRSPKLSRATKRIVSRAGRKAVETKLLDLEEKHGVTVTCVNPAYTSRECSACGFVREDNRRGKAFHCHHCGMKLHADTNAARVIKGRSLESLILSGVRKEQVLVLLDRRFTARHGYSMAKVP
jgi:hypothetical protein